MINQRILDWRMILRGTVTALVCSGWLLANLATAQEAEPPRRKATPPPVIAEKETKQKEEAVLRVYRLEHAAADDVVRVLAATMSGKEGIRMDADPRSRSIIVLAPQEDHDQVSELIQVLDVPPETEAPQRVTQIYRLKHAQPDAIANVLNNILREDDRMVMAFDKASNSVVVSASKEQHQRVEDLIKELDVPPARDVAHQYEHKVFELVNAQARDVAEILRTLLGPDEKIAVDERTNSILVQAPKDTALAVWEILSKLDEMADKDPKKHDSGTTFQVRVVWLASGLSDDDAANPSDDLKEVLNPLRSMGVKDLRQVGQVIVNSAPSVFQVRCSPILNQRPTDLDINGEFLREQATPTMRIQLSASQTEEASSGDPRRPPTRSVRKKLVELETVITTPLGHYVVLGVSPVEKMTSVFIVQITASKK